MKEFYVVKIYGEGNNLYHSLATSEEENYLDNYHFYKVRGDDGFFDVSKDIADKYIKESL